MSHNETIYNTQAATCRGVGYFLEVKQEELRLYQMLLDYDRIERTKKEINTVREELYELYDQQIDLYFIIQQERSEAIRNRNAKNLSNLVRNFEYNKSLMHH